VFGALSAALIILLTTLLVKKTLTSKTNQNVEMGYIARRSEAAERQRDRTGENDTGSVMNENEDPSEESESDDLDDDSDEKSGGDYMNTDAAVIEEIYDNHELSRLK
jgi:hypothetical protein